MAIDRHIFLCGCRFQTSDVEVAKMHSDKEGHTMFAKGEIRPDIPGRARRIATHLAREGN